MVVEVIGRTSKSKIFGSNVPAIVLATVIRKPFSLIHSHPPHYITFTVIPGLCHPIPHYHLYSSSRILSRDSANRKSLPDHQLQTPSPSLPPPPLPRAINQSLQPTLIPLAPPRRSITYTLHPDIPFLPSKPHTQPLSWPRPSSSRPRSLSFSPSSSTPSTPTRRSSSEN